MIIQTIEAPSNGRFHLDLDLTLPENLPPDGARFEIIVKPARPEAQNKRLEAYQRLQKYAGSIHQEIDYKKELAEARDAKYGSPS
jgi:hypothetical protein